MIRQFLRGGETESAAPKNGGNGHRYAFRELSDLRPGDHLCCIFRTPQEHRQVLTRFMRDGLERHQKVLYVYDSTPAEAIKSYLREDGTDPGAYLRTGQLSLIPVKEAYMLRKVFRPEDMLAYWKTELGRAQAQGYVVLRVTGETTWAQCGYPGTERFMEYEARLNEFVPGNPCIVLCQYDLHKTSPRVLLDVLLTHPVTAVGTELYDNFYYVPPAQFLSSHAEDARVHLSLQQLEHRKQLERDLEDARAQLQAMRPRQE